MTCPVLGGVRWAMASRVQVYSEASWCLLGFTEGVKAALQGGGGVRHCSGSDEQQQMLAVGRN